jgi:hypothetical protein
MVMRSLACALLVLGTFAYPAEQPSRIPIGSYRLADVAGRRPPLYLGGGFNGEGASLDSIFLLIQPRGRFTARVVVSWTDSGTVWYPRTTHGTWRLQGPSIVFSYAKAASAGGCWYGTCADSSAADTGRVVTDGVTFHRFAGVGRSVLGEDAVLRFRRTPR